MTSFGTNRSSVLLLVALGTALLVVPGTLKAQEDGRDCVLGAGGGVRLEPHGPVAVGFGTTPDMGTGGVFRLDLACPVGGDERLRIGGGLEVEAPVEHMSLGRVLAAARLDVTSLAGLGASWRGEAVAAAGWTLSGVPHGSVLLPPRRPAIDAGSSGPTLGIGLRVARRLTGALSMDFRAEWRGALLDEMGPGTISRGHVLVHTIPITLGLAVDL